MPAPHHSIFKGRKLFLPPEQQRQSTEGTKKISGSKQDHNLTMAKLKELKQF